LEFSGANAAYSHALEAPINVILSIILKYSIFENIAVHFGEHSQNKLQNSATKPWFFVANKCVAKSRFWGFVFNQCAPSTNFLLCMLNLYHMKKGPAMVLHMRGLAQARGIGAWLWGP